MKINVDLGEEFLGKPADHEKNLMPYIDWANIACGGHSGDPQLMDQCVQLAKKNQVIIGAHPGYPDPENFGRKVMKLSAEELRQSLFDQVSQLDKIAKSHHYPLKYLKLHGALYHQATQERAVWELASEVVRKFNLNFMLVPDHFKRPRDWTNISTKGEVFGDRGTHPDGSLISRSQPGALLNEPEEAIALYQKYSKQNCDTICFHGDHPKALTLLKSIQRAMIQIYALSPEYIEIELAPESRICPQILKQNLLALPEVIHVHWAFQSFLIRSSSSFPDANQLEKTVSQSFGGKRETLSSKRFLIPVFYGKSVGLDQDQFPADLIEQHISRDYQIRAIGFAPGFAYCSNVPSGLQLKRRPSPRKRVTAGSVAIANQFTAIYPQDGPGGWNIVGNTPIRLFEDPLHLPYQTGDYFRFRAMSEREWNQLKEDKIVLSQDHLV